MAERWVAARGALQALADGVLQAFAPEHEAAFARFIDCYADHLRHEDDTIYPAACAVLDEVCPTAGLMMSSAGLG